MTDQLSVLRMELGPLFAAALACLGLIIGSFLNVVIARVPEDRSIVRPRSRCPRCGHPIAWFENIPVFSWVLLRGRCSACQAPISWRYPAVELLTAVLFLFCLARFDWSWQLASALMLTTLLIPLSFIDLEHWLLPFSLTLPGIGLGLIFSIPFGWSRLRESIIGAAAGFFGFWALEWLGEKLFKKEALGGGDKYLLAMLGAFLGYRALLGVVFLASVQGAVVGTILLLLFGRAGPALASAPRTAVEPGDASPPPAELEPGGESAPRSSEEDWKPGPHNLPFGPWLSLGALEVLLLGPWLAHRLPILISGWFLGA